MKKRPVTAARLETLNALGPLSARNTRALAMPPERIRYIRTLHGCSQAMMAVLCNVTRVAYLRWEHGQTTPNKQAAVILNRLDEEGRALYGLPFPSKDYSVPQALQDTRPLPTPAPEAIRALRLSLGASQTTFGRLCGVTRFTVANWETGQTKPLQTACRSIQKIKDTYTK